MISSTTTTKTKSSSEHSCTLSFVPKRAWGNTIADFVPAKEFNHTQCSAAKEYARVHKLAMFSCEISDTSRAMFYLAGCWKSTIEDMLLRKELWTHHGTSDIMATSPDALGAVYECIIGADQQTLPFFDLEYYANSEHGNEECPDIESKTKTVARLSTALMSALFPHQIQVVQNADKNLVHAMKEIPTIEKLLTAHYRNNNNTTTHADQIPTPLPPSTVDPRHDWCVLDASRGEKRSQHLILSPDAGVCWDTLVDQALFVGLLIRCIYEMATTASPPKSAYIGDDRGIIGLCQSLFITELSTASRKTNAATDADPDIVEKRKKMWTTIVDTVVYKKFQLIRTAYSSKRTQNRPLVPIWHTERPKGWHLRHTLVTRVPTDPHQSHRLSFSQCYPTMFPKEAPPSPDPTNLEACSLCRFPPTSSRSLDRWKWVPNYQGQRNEAPPTTEFINTPKASTTGPWGAQTFQKAVALWLQIVDPSRELEIQWGPTTIGGMTGSTFSPPRHLDLSTSAIVYNSSNGEAQTASHCLAKFMTRCPELRPWISKYKDIRALASSMTVKPRMRSDPVTGVVYRTALVSLNVKYCPIQKTQHQNGRPFMIINDNNGQAQIRCLAEKCESSRYLLSMVLLPEQLKLVFPRHNRMIPPQPVISKTADSTSLTGSISRKRQKLE